MICDKNWPAIYIYTYTSRSLVPPQALSHDRTGEGSEYKYC